MCPLPTGCGYVALENAFGELHHVAHGQHLDARRRVHERQITGRQHAAPKPEPRRLAHAGPGLRDRPCLARKTQLELFRWRHEHVLGGVARRLKKGIGDGRDPFSVLVDCQDHVITAARSWVDLVVLEAFAGAAEQHPLLATLCSLFALSRIEAERGWYQEHGKLTGARSKAVIRTVNELLAELRPHAGELVDAFGVPESCLEGDARPGGSNSRHPEGSAHAHPVAAR